MATQFSFVSQETVASIPSEPLSSPPIDDVEYETEYDLLEGLNTYTKQYGYSVVIRSTKKNNKGIKDKAYITCSRGRKPESDHKRKATGKRAATSKRIDCPFQCLAELIKTEVQRSEHNHDGTNQASYPKLRSYFMTQEEVLEDIRAQHESDSKPGQILTFLQNKHKLDPSNPVTGAKGIYNAIQKIRDEELQNMSSIQALNITLKNSER